jgi:hypothetical protein
MLKYALFSINKKNEKRLKMLVSGVLRYFHQLLGGERGDLIFSISNYLSISCVAKKCVGHDLDFFVFSSLKIRTLRNLSLILYKDKKL